MKKNVLIIGYGRAGKRHEQIARRLGLVIWLYDPLVFKDQTPLTLEALLVETTIQYAVICTPPSLHLQYIRLLIPFEVKILCEKPLCDIGQLEGAQTLASYDNRVMVAYNYRYHPAIEKVAGGVGTFGMNCYQSRPDLPEWGLLLDHCSHDLDIIRTITGHQVKILSATEYKDEGVTCWAISTCCGTLTETVSTFKVPRVATIKYAGGQVNIDPDPLMFEKMWSVFLAGDYYPSLKDAIITQELLEDCYRLNKESKDDK